MWCSMCYRGFETNVKLKKHIASAHVKKEFQCSFCEKSFALKQSLRRHFAAKHEKNKSTKIQSNIHLLKNNEPVHEKNKSNSSLGYNETFYPSHNFENKSQLSNDMKRYKCLHCDACFTQSGDMLEHFITFHELRNV